MNWRNDFYMFGDVLYSLSFLPCKDYLKCKNCHDFSLCSSHGAPSLIKKIYREAGSQRYVSYKNDIMYREAGKVRKYIAKKMENSHHVGLQWYGSFYTVKNMVLRNIPQFTVHLWCVSITLTEMKGARKGVRGRNSVPYLALFPGQRMRTWEQGYAIPSIGARGATAPPPQTNLS